MREKKMMNLINSMDPGEEDGEPIPGTSGGSAAAAAIIVEHGHCNPLDDTLVAQMHPVQPPLSNSSSSNICSVRVIHESHNNNNNSSRNHRKNKNKAGKKASVELLPIGSGSGGTEGDDGGYVNELALVDSERQQSIDELIPVHQEAYRMEGGDGEEEEDEEEVEELAVDSDDSSQCDLQPNTSARRKL